MTKRNGIIILGILLGGPACASPKEQVFAPLDTAPISSDDLGISDSASTMSASASADGGRTVGRFPSGLSVARVTAIADVTDPSRRLRSEAMLVERAAYWNQMMDNLPPVREVTVLRQMGIDPRGVSRGDFLHESTRIDCRFCLLFGKADEDVGAPVLLGALWDAPSVRPIAAYRVPVLVDEAKLLEADDETKRQAILNAAEASAEHQLRTQVRDTLWDLSRLDEPEATTQPSPWRTDDVLLPRDRDPLRRIEDLLRKSDE